MTEKNKKSKDMQNHKKPMPKDILQVEFGQEMGDVNASQIYNVLEGNKGKSNRKKSER
ncbi:hypothetical protein [Metabacillus niabensis]|uniref:Uncharacterized protein n=1 Tax=Metabacillus niabensis TaxID=324854 RepID=A0ABT9YUL3_9BACI|nr:hypothetical protein [Metabacillus niabensis]MDQ0223690.1 hypothetical protein [Metabacillus niabensis]